MKRSHAKTVNQTFSIPAEIAHELHVYIKRREMSLFVSEAIRKELELRKNELKEAYIAMSEDEEQSAMLKEWEGTVADGIEEEEW
ncbi:MAG: hypothetical protein K940chlam9_01596 [Chlamydiae bacterium]|nr:hypothetical protein [Chlamydiota bacterium]